MSHAFYLHISYRRRNSAHQCHSNALLSCPPDSLCAGGRFSCPGYHGGATRRHEQGEGSFDSAFRGRPLLQQITENGRPFPSGPESTAFKSEGRYAAGGRISPWIRQGDIGARLFLAIQSQRAGAPGSVAGPDPLGSHGETFWSGQTPFERGKTVFIGVFQRNGASLPKGTGPGRILQDLNQTSRIESLSSLLFQEANQLFKLGRKVFQTVPVGGCPPNKGGIQ